MKVNGLMIKDLGKAMRGTKRVTHMKETLLIIKLMVEVFINGRKVKFMMVSG
jgi:hypothetical protein